jgi:hypothetical protein
MLWMQRRGRGASAGHKPRTCGRERLAPRAQLASQREGVQQRERQRQSNTRKRREGDGKRVCANLGLQRSY